MMALEIGPLHRLPVSMRLLIVLLGFLTNSCVEIIDFEIKDRSRQLIIYGQINNSTLYDQRIRISRSTTTNRPPVNIDDAFVQVFDGDGNAINYAFDEVSGNYLPAVPFTGSPGMSYQLRVVVDNNTYTSNYQRMPVTTASDQTYFEFERREVLSQSGIAFEQWFVKILTDTEIPPSAEPLFIKRDLLQTYLQQEMSLPLNVFPFYSPRNCYISQPWIGTSILLFNGALVNSFSISRQLVGEMPLDNSFTGLRGFGVVQSSISREALEYWQKVDDVSNRTGSIFEVPPAPIPGNIRNEEDEEDLVLGFFEVAKVDTSGTSITGDDLPVFLGLNGNFVNCDFLSQNTLSRLPFSCFPCLEQLGIDPSCYNCLLTPNSTLIRPKYLD